MQVGDRIPEFEVTLDDRRRVPFASLLADGPIVLFFYPKAFTPGCTREVCRFRDISTELATVGARPVGVSRDTPSTQAHFADAFGLGFPLIADVSGEVARVFGAKRPGPLWSKRKTFVIDRDGTVLGVICSETDMDAHADEALAILGDGPRVCS